MKTASTASNNTFARCATESDLQNSDHCENTYMGSHGFGGAIEFIGNLVHHLFIGVSTAISLEIVSDINCGMF